MADDASPEQIAEYEAQLENINELLEADPNDESLLALKNDIEELLALTKGSLPPPPPGPPPPPEGTSEEASDSVKDESITNDAPLELPLPPAPPVAAAAPDASDSNAVISAAVAAGASAAASAIPDMPLPQTTTTTTTVAKPPSKKKKEKVKDFVIPNHLLPNEADTEAERNKKRRAVKALKNKWREKKKTVESDNRQKSWQSFQKKTKTKRKGDSKSSIFSTKEGVNDRVGVISKKKMTEFGSRKRHKHS